MPRQCSAFRRTSPRPPCCRWPTSPAPTSSRRSDCRRRGGRIGTRGRAGARDEERCPLSRCPLSVTPHDDPGQTENAQRITDNENPPMPVHLEYPSTHPHVAVVPLDRPERANALDPPMLAELAAAWRRIAADADVRCAVLTGAGERVFCAGMDMRATIPVAQALARG